MLATAASAGTASTMERKRCQVNAFDKLHDQEIAAPGLLGVVGGHDVRVGELGRRPHLAPEAFDDVRLHHQLGADNLESDGSRHELVLGLVDGSHASATPLPSFSKIP